MTPTVRRRPPQPRNQATRVPLMIKTPPEVRADLDQLAKKKGVTLSYYVSNLLEKHLLEEHLRLHANKAVQP